MARLMFTCVILAAIGCAANSASQTTQEYEVIERPAITIQLKRNSGAYNSQATTSQLLRGKYPRTPDGLYVINGARYREMLARPPEAIQAEATVVLIPVQ